MPVTFRLTTTTTCRWAISPLREVTSAVRMLTRPDRQGYHQPWLRAVAPVLDELDLTPLLQVMRGHHNPDFLMPPPDGPSPVFADELALVRRTPAAQVRTELSRSLHAQHGRRLPPPAQALVDHPLRARALLADTLAACWERLIEPWWPRLRDVLAGDIAYRTGVLADGGLAAVLTDLHPMVRWQDPVLTVEMPVTGHRDVGAAGMVLMPSAFEWPNVGVMLDEPWLPTVDYPARGIAALWAPRTDPSAALDRLIGRTRAVLLSALAEPMSTTGLARRCGLPNSTVSEHLTVLRDAGLVTTHRVGRWLRHTRTPLGTQLSGSS
ncbi:ArsR/SmtB family transcription factor [Actinophytocola sp. KF-1]